MAWSSAQAQLVSQIHFQFVLPPFQLQNALHHLRFRQLRLRHFRGQLISFALSFLRHLHNLLRTFLFRAQQFQ